MKLFNKLFRVLKKPYRLLLFLDNNRIITLKDENFLKLKYRENMKKKLDLKNPQTFNEKLQWLKLYDRKTEYTRMVDKYEVKEYIREKLGEEYIIPTLGIYNKFEEIDFDRLPNQFVIKCTHDSGGLAICKDKLNFDIEKARKKINKSLKRNYYYTGREWPYKNVKPRIIIEEFLGDNLFDYRFYCFNSNPKYCYLYTNESLANGSKPETIYCNIYDEDWNEQSFRNKCYRSEKKVDQPYNFELMKQVSKILSKNISFLRVDFYEIDKKIYIGELTFFPGAGFSIFNPKRYDKILGDMLQLPIGKKEEFYNEER